MDLRPGSTVRDARGELHIIDYLGQGSFGLVFKARNEAGKLFAVKTISTAYLDDDQLRALQNEGNLATGIRDPNVLTVHFFHDGSLYPDLPPYLVADYANSGTLEDLIRGRKSPFGSEDLNSMFVQLANGMKAVNARLVHRDVKPDNVLVHDGKLKIADFGLSKIVDALTRSSGQTFKGVNHIMYCAPEAWLGQANTIAMDMYSMGIVFYRLAAGQHPFEIDQRCEPISAWREAHMSRVALDPRKLNPALTFSTAQMILKMMAKRPEDRYTSWEEVLHSLAGTETSHAAATPDHIGPLLEKVLERKLSDDEARLAEERKQAETLEIGGRIRFAFGELKREIVSVIAEFNTKSEFVKLKIKEMNRTSADEFHIVSDRPVKIAWDRPYVVVEVTANDGGWSLPLEQRRVIAAGKAATNGERGVNLLLLAENEADLFGTWYVLSSRPNPLFNRDRSAADPHAFSDTELAAQLPNIGSLHTYQMKLTKWDRQVIAEVIGYIL